MEILHEVRDDSGNIISRASNDMTENATLYELGFGAKLESYGFVHVREEQPIICDGFYYSYTTEEGFSLFEIHAGTMMLALQIKVLHSASAIVSMNHFFQPDCLYVLIHGTSEESEEAEESLIAFGYDLATPKALKKYNKFHTDYPRLQTRSGNFHFQTKEEILFNPAAFSTEQREEFLADVDYSLNGVAYDEE